MALMLKAAEGSSLAKNRKLNPYKRITKGNIVNVTVDGAAVEAIVDNAGKYTYLNVGGVDYYVSEALVEGAAYGTEEFVAPVKAEKKPKKAKKAAEGEAEAVMGEGDDGDPDAPADEGDAAEVTPKVRRRKAAAEQGSEASA